MTEFSDYAKSISAPPMKEVYETLLAVLDSYMVMKPEDLKTVAMWCMACADKNSFLTFPELYMNACRGSGKTRLLKLIEAVIPNFQLTQSISESALFRLPNQKKLNGLGIDEAERMQSKEKSLLRELLNSCYKRGGKVLRSVKTKDGKYEVEEFEVFMGVALANIYGLESVLEDRAITIILERAKDKIKTKIPEFFTLDSRIKFVKQGLEANLVTLVGDTSPKTDVVERIFYYLLPSITMYHSHTPHTSVTSVTPNIPFKVEEFIKTMVNSDLNGRALELWLPLLITAAFVGGDVLAEFVEIAQNKATAKERTQMVDDTDTIFGSFLYGYFQSKGHANYVTLKTLKEEYENQEEKRDWLTNDWIGRFFARTNLAKDSRRIGRVGREIIPDMEKIKTFLTQRGIPTDAPDDEPPTPPPKGKLLDYVPTGSAAGKTTSLEAVTPNPPAAPEAGAGSTPSHELDSPNDRSPPAPDGKADAIAPQKQGEPITAPAPQEETGAGTSSNPNDTKHPAPATIVQQGKAGEVNSELAILDPPQPAPKYLGEYSLFDPKGSGDINKKALAENILKILKGAPAGAFENSVLGYCTLKFQFPLEMYNDVLTNLLNLGMVYRPKVGHLRLVSATSEDNEPEPAL